VMWGADLGAANAAAAASAISIIGWRTNLSLLFIAWKDLRETACGRTTR
jgi:hypothetical protein